MTEPNEPTTPLARMRFSWQRGTDVSDAPEAADDESVDEDAVEPEAVERDVVERDVDEREAGSLRAGGTPVSPSRPEPGPADRPAQESQPARRAQPESDLPTTPATPRAEPSDPSAVPTAASATPTNGHAVTDDSATAAASRRVSEEARNRLDESRSASPSKSQPEPDVDDPAWVATDLGELDDDTPAESESRRQRKRRERRERKSQAAETKAAQKDAQKDARKSARTRTTSAQAGGEAGVDEAVPSTSRTPAARANVGRPATGPTRTATTATTATPLTSRSGTRLGTRPVAPAPASKRSRRDRGDFDVPAPGRRFSGGRAAHTGLRVALVLTACLLALGVVAYSAFALGISTGRDNSPRLSAADLARYRLTAFPTAEAGQFAADYARLCFTHDPTPGANDAREQRLARYVSGGTDPRCGWNGEGSQSVVDATWTGESEPIDVPGLQGNARMMTVRVLTDSGSSRIVTVPVYVADLAHANGMRIVGDIGEMPQPNLAAPPEVKPPSATDSRLSEALTQGQFFEQFFTAWGASDRPALQRLVTPDATARTTAGLNRIVASPTIQEARVFLPKGADPSTPYDWKTGQTTQAWVWVVWQTPGEGSKTTETRGYRLQLEKTTQASSPTQEWAVRDIQGGIPDVKGG